MASPLRLPWYQQVPAYIHELREHRRTEWCLPQQCVTFRIYLFVLKTVTSNKEAEAHEQAGLRESYWVRILDLLMLACRRVYITIRSQSKAMPYISHQPGRLRGRIGN